ncbi:hypothetical protein GWK47_028236 [Chionoecetes opilio]|uniref:Uncharacterized protein n=1 Tax=Chionoecetes opilio TaxID=41210 RepID=A0A8J4YLK5_CHIOP|nr:hypothetical protein GWK47_028236 [Chionoecetes opilio]
MPGLPGTPPAARHAQRVLAGRPPATRGKEADIQPIPKQEPYHKLRPISPHQLPAKTAERMVLSATAVAVGALQPHSLVFGFTRGVGTADGPPHPAALRPKTCPQSQSSSTLRKRSSGQSSRYSPHPREEGDPGKTARLGSRTTSSPVGPESSSGATNPATRKLENGTPRAGPSSARFLLKPADGGAGRPPLSPGWHRPAPATPTTWPSLSPGGVTGL